MEIEIESGLVKSPGKSESGFAEGISRLKSPLRMQYTAEIKVFRTQYGGLEDIRQKLGFSRRKMCQLLLVDPSAWTRWCKDESKVPPHVYRALEWFLALNQKALTQPDLAAIFSARYGITSSLKSEAELAPKFRALQVELERQRWVVLALTGALGALTLTLFFVL